MPKVKFKARTTTEIENLDIENGSVIYNTENGKTYLDYNNERIPTGGGAGGGVATGDTPPENPEENDLWVDTNDEEHLAEVDATVSTTSTNAVQNQAITNFINGDVLYSDTTGSATSIQLDENPLNYKRVVIYGGDGNIRNLVQTTIYPSENVNFQLQIDEIGNGWFALICMVGKLTSTNITITSQYTYNGSGYSSSTDLKIKKVIGYNY